MFCFGEYEVVLEYLSGPAFETQGRRIEFNKDGWQS